MDCILPPSQTRDASLATQYDAYNARHRPTIHLISPSRHSASYFTHPYRPARSSAPINLGSTAKNPPKFFSPHVNSKNALYPILSSKSGHASGSRVQPFQSPTGNLGPFLEVRSQWERKKAGLLTPRAGHSRWPRQNKASRHTIRLNTRKGWHGLRPRLTRVSSAGIG